MIYVIRSDRTSDPFNPALTTNTLLRIDFAADTMADIAKLPGIDKIRGGSTVKIIQNGESYMLGENGWVKVAMSDEGGGVGDIVKILPKTITENGTYNALAELANGFNPVIVNVDISGKWKRPTDRPMIPEINDNEAYLLFGVGPNNLYTNDYALLIQTNAVGVNYQIDWGDGTVDIITRNTKAEHVYNYDTISASISAEGFKFVWIKVTLTDEGTITIFNIQQRSSASPAMGTTSIIRPQIFEMYIKASALTTLGYTSSARYNWYAYMDIFKLIGINNITSLWQYTLSNCHVLKVCEIDVSKATNLASCLLDAYELEGIGNPDQPLNLNGVVASASSFLINARKFRQAIINTGGITNFTSFPNGWTEYDTPINFDTSHATIITGFGGGLSNYSGTITINASGTTTAFTAAVVNGTMRKLRGLRIQNMGTLHAILTVQGTMMDENAIALLIQDLPDRTGLTAGAANFQGNRRNIFVSDSAKALAASKNWTLSL